MAGRNIGCLPLAFALAVAAAAATASAVGATQSSDLLGAAGWTHVVVPSNAGQHEGTGLRQPRSGSMHGVAHSSGSSGSAGASRRQLSTSAHGMGTPLPGGTGDSSSGPECLDWGHKEPIDDFTWLSNVTVRRKARTNLGDTARLRVALDRLKNLPADQTFTVSFVGGSVTAGQGAQDGKSGPLWAEAILKAALGPNVKVHNGAMPGTPSSYMSVCHNVHLPRDSDVIFVEYALNDDHNVIPIMDNPIRRPFERLLRKLLSYPKRPAIVLLHAFAWHKVFTKPSGQYWDNSERDFHEFATYYGLPAVSVKAAALPLMLEGVRGFMVDKTRGDWHGSRRPALEDENLKGRVFYWDVIHPDGNTGHKFMGEIAAQVVLDAVASVQHEPVHQDERAAVAAELPPPVLPNNWQSAQDRCFVGLAFHDVVTSHDGWEYKDEAKDRGKPKLGFISSDPGSILRIKVSTHAAAGDETKPVSIELSYLRSYQNMGRAAVVCESGCTCERTVLDGHHEQRNSQLHLHEFKASQHQDCVVSVTVLPESTTPGAHKVKIAGIIISEEGGQDGVKNFAAIQQVIEGADKNGGAFDIRIWAKQDAVNVTLPTGRVLRI